MTDQVISPLRRRMIEDMAIRKLAPKTQRDYVQRVRDFATFLGRSPDTAKSEEVRGFRLHLASSGAGTPKINATVSALRFLFNVTLDRADLAKHLSFMHEPRKVPVVLSPEEVARFLEAAPNIEHKAALSVAYGAGLRVSEVVSLKVSDIDSERMMLRVEQGKGSKDRHPMLSPVLLELLRLVSHCAAAGLAIPGPESCQPDDDAPTHACLPRRGKAAGIVLTRLARRNPIEPPCGPRARKANPHQRRGPPCMGRLPSLHADRAWRGGVGGGEVARRSPKQRLLPIDRPPPTPDQVRGRLPAHLIAGGGEKTTPIRK
jgi:integrase